MEPQAENERYVVTFSDFIKFVKQYYYKILIISVLCSCFYAFLSMNKAIVYEIKASFKERGLAKASFDSGSLGMFFGNGSSEKQAEATTWMSSHQQLKQLVLEMNLQGSIQKKKQSLFRFFSRMKENIFVELAYLMRKKVPGVVDKPSEYFFTEIFYPKEIPLHLEIKFLENNRYVVFDILGKVIGKGELGQRFSFDESFFTLNRNPEVIPKENLYTVELLSADNVVKDLLSVIKFENSPKDSELLLIHATYPNRHLGAHLINNLMRIYKENRTKEQQRISKEQIHYLETRQSQVGVNLRQTMLSYADEQSQDILKNGYLCADTAIEFLATSQQEQQRRLLAIDLEIKRLRKVLTEGYVYYDRYHVDGDPTTINTLLTEMRGLNQRADEIKLSLQEARVNFDENDSFIFTKQFTELNDIELQLSELKVIHKEIQNDNIVSISDELLNDPKIMLKSWYEKLREYRREFDSSMLEKNEWEHRKKQFMQYVHNLIELFEVHEKALRQRLAHQGDLKDEFLGIDLSLAHELFINYNRELNGIDGVTVKLKWVLENLKDPKFELNSLTSQLSDPISTKIIHEYSDLLLKLRDEHNLSSKEQNRIKDELLRQRAFFEMHIKQTLEISELTVDLLKTKTSALNKVSLALIQQKISLLEKQLESYVTHRIQNLIHEADVIQAHLKKLTEDMAKIPQKKITEKLIQQKLDESLDLGKEITHLVETKNIVSNLEVVQSTPVDLAYPPLFPKHPKILFQATLGLIFGLFISTVYFLCKNFFNGVRVSEENLEQMHLHVSGTLSPEFLETNNEPLQDQDLAVIRKISNQLLVNDKTTLLILGAEQETLSKHLALLAYKKGLKIFYIPLNFDKINQPSELGLLQYLEGSVDFPQILKGEFFDTLSLGKASRYGSELIHRKKFKILLQKLSESYDAVIVFSNSKATSAEAESLLPLFDSVCVNLKDEKLQSLDPIRSIEKQGKIKLTFVFNS